MSNHRRNLVYDFPTRLFHWIFAGLFLTAFGISKLLDDESRWFNYHSLAGLTLGFLVLLRVLWGFTGTKHARFSNFALNPKDLFGYVKGMLMGNKSRWAGHNPASSWAGIGMMLMAIGLAITGFLMTSGSNKEFFEDFHEFFANAFMILVLLHVLGIILHTIRHREIIGLSMIDGRKVNIESDEVIPSSRSSIGFLMIGIVVVFGLYINRNYDDQTNSLDFFGTKLQLTTNEANAESDAEDN
jgi:cytochrome b